MGDKLGILVTSDKHIDHLIGITKAAYKAGKDVSIFLTNRGVFLSKDERLSELDGICHVSLCNLCFDFFKLTKPVHVVKDKDFGTQARNAQMISECDRFIVI